MKKILTSIVLLIISLNLTACDPVSKKLYGIPFTEPAPPFWTMIESDESRLKIGEDLTIKFYYASEPDYPSMYGPRLLSYSAKIVIKHNVFGDFNGENYLSTLEEELVLKEIESFDNTSHYPVDESIVFPAEWFVGERGFIGCFVMVDLILAEEEHITQGFGNGLYYRVEGENIILYNSYYKFFNDIRAEGMFGFRFDFGTITVALFLVLYIIFVVAFHFTKRNKIFVVESKEKWHKVHVVSSICTIPFIIVHIFLLFIINQWLKIGVTLFLFILVIVTWKLVVHFINKDNLKTENLI